MHNMIFRTCRPQVCHLAMKRLLMRVSTRGCCSVARVFVVAQILVVALMLMAAPMLVVARGLVIVGVFAVPQVVIVEVGLRRGGRP